MEFMGKKVVHKMLGEGIVIQHQGSKVTVRFADCETDFSYPQSFQGFLVFEDTQDQEELLQMLRKDEEDRMAAEAKDVTRRFVTPQTVTHRAGSRQTSSHSPFSKRKDIASNIAFKCNYCDGGKSPCHVGFLRACSDDVMEYNIYTAGHSWCCNEESYCMQYMRGEISRRELDEMCAGDGYVCYESQMLRQWKALAGYGLSGEKKDEPRKIWQVQRNSLAVLTTREPYADESSRFIFGVFLIDAIDQGSSLNEGCVWSESRYRVELRPEEAHQMKFWNYHANENHPEKPAWAQGLYRYLTDVEAAQILRDIAALKKNNHEKSVADEFFDYFCRIHALDVNAIPAANGALKR